ncbi:MAG: pantetheine-phosphate adenylyltransferase [Elusimicrobia bacterium]|nr:pantetheine-phosphate adenylyltransferase [Elusimicrobiota bacterium]
MKKRTRAIYPGTFDPVTNGHVDILGRAAELFDEVVVAVAASTAKDTLFALPERVALLNRVIASARLGAKVTVEPFSGLLVHYAKRKRIPTLIRGIRAISDFEYEFQMALMNRHLMPDLETVFLMPDEKFVYLSSTMVREVARLNGDLRAFLPKVVVSAVEAKYRRS